MSDDIRLMSLPRFRRNTAPPACFYMFRRCPRRTALAMWDRLRSSASINSMTQAKAGGRRCRWARRGTGTLRINPCRLSSATDS